LSLHPFVVEADMEHSDPEMSVEQFMELLDRHGCDPERWPDNLKPAADALLAASEEARQRLRLDQVVSGLVRMVPERKAPPSLLGRIMDKTRK
jgi:hypothetical protein